MRSRLARVLAVLLLFALGCWALAEGGTRVYVYAYAVKVYESPSKKSELVTQVPFARAMTKIAEKGDWAQVITPDNRTGYCSRKQLTEDNPNTYDVTVYAQQDRAPVYELPTVDAPMIGQMDKNDRAKAVAMTPMGDWLRIQLGGKDGYIQRPRVDFNRYAAGRAAWAAADRVAVRYDPAIASSYAELSRGQKVAVVDVDGEWAKIRSGSGLIGYCRVDQLTKEKPE